jgi:hypothetical protein
MQVLAINCLGHDTAPAGRATGIWPCEDQGDPLGPDGPAPSPGWGQAPSRPGDIDLAKLIGRVSGGRDLAGRVGLPSRRCRGAG